MTVGFAPAEALRNRKVNRVVSNPMDKCTIVSIYPREINDVKETLQPNRYIVPAGSMENPSVVTVGPAVWQQDYDADKPIQEIPVSSIQVADSVIRDYCVGLLEVQLGVAQPGMFFIHGAVPAKDIKVKYMMELQKALEWQKAWYYILIGKADALWSHSGGNSRVIWDMMRVAARETGQENKPWMKDVLVQTMERCFACGSLKNPEYPICASCKTIDPKHPMASQIKTAG